VITDSVVRDRTERSIRQLYQLLGAGSPVILWMPCPRSAFVTVLSLLIAKSVTKSSMITEKYQWPGPRPGWRFELQWHIRLAHSCQVHPDLSDNRTIGLIDQETNSFASASPDRLDSVNMDDSGESMEISIARDLIKKAARAHSYQRDVNLMFIEVVEHAISGWLSTRAPTPVSTLPGARFRLTVSLPPPMRADLIDGCGALWTLDPVCVVCEPFQSIQAEPWSQLERFGGPSAVYASGEEVYHWQGVRVPKLVVRKPEQITVEMIDTEPNTEVRRIMLERYGWARYVVDSGGEIIDRSTFGTLYRKAVDGRSTLAVVRVRNSTPEPDGSHRYYQLLVPPHIRTARQAVAWTFGLREEDYTPLVET